MSIAISLNPRENIGSFEALPYEIILQIFTNLNYQELGRIATTCQYLKIISEDNSLWKPLIASIEQSALPKDVPNIKKYILTNFFRIKSYEDYAIKLEALARKINLNQIIKFTCYYPSTKVYDICEFGLINALETSTINKIEIRALFIISSIADQTFISSSSTEKQYNEVDITLKFSSNNQKAVKFLKIENRLIPTLEKKIRDSSE